MKTLDYIQRKESREYARREAALIMDRYSPKKYGPRLTNYFNPKIVS